MDPDSITRLRWNVNIRSVQEDEFDKVCLVPELIVAAQTDVIASILEPSYITLFITISWLSIEFTKDNYKTKVFVSKHTEFICKRFKNIMRLTRQAI